MRSSCVAIGCLIVLCSGGRVEAQDEPIIWPSLHVGGPQTVAVGLAIQPPFEGLLDKLLMSASVGKGGVKAGAGVGMFGGSLMSGAALQLTVLRRRPRLPLAPATFVGLEGQLMLGNLSIKAGPAVRLGRAGTGSRFRVNWEFGLGF